MSNFINQTYSAILILLERALFNSNKQLNNNDIDWKSIYKASVEHSVSALVFDATKDLDAAKNMPESIKKQWEISAFATFSNNERLMQNQSVAIDLLRNNGIDAVIIKGSSSSALYNKPYLRSLGDIDVLVPISQFEKACAIFDENNYVSEKDTKPHHCHKTYFKNSCIFELHYLVNGIPESEMGKNIESCFEAFPNSVRSTSYDEYSFPDLSVNLQGLTLILHIYEHLCKTGLGFRQLCDWAMFINAGVDESFLENLKEYGLFYLAQAVTKICVDYLGLDKTKCEWCLSADDDICLSLLLDFIDSGNFGRRKGNNYHGSDLFISHDNSKVNFFSNYRTIAYSSWPICYKYKILLIVSPFVIFVRHIFRVISGKRDKVNLFSVYSKANKRKKLYKKLDVFKKETS